MMTEPSPTCRPCGLRGIVTLATWARNDDEVQNWTLCGRHADMLGAHYLTSYGPFTRLPDPAEARRVNGEAEG